MRGKDESRGQPARSPESLARARRSPLRGPFGGCRAGEGTTLPSAPPAARSPPRGGLRGAGSGAQRGSAALGAGAAGLCLPPGAAGSGPLRLGLRSRGEGTARFLARVQVLPNMNKNVLIRANSLYAAACLWGIRLPKEPILETGGRCAAAEVSLPCCVSAAGSVTAIPGSCPALRPRTVLVVIWLNCDFSSPPQHTSINKYSTTTDNV